MDAETLDETLREFFVRAGDIRTAIENGKLSPEYTADFIQSYILEVKAKILKLNK